MVKEEPRSVERQPMSVKISGVKPKSSAQVAVRPAQTKPQAVGSEPETYRPVLPAGVQPWGSRSVKPARIAGRSVLERSETADPATEMETYKPISPAGVRPTGRGLVGSIAAPLSRGLTLEQHQQFRDQGIPIQPTAFPEPRLSSFSDEERAELLGLDEPSLEAVTGAESGQAAEPDRLLYKPKRPKYQTDLQFAQDLAMAEPKMVAHSIKDWLNPK